MQLESLAMVVGALSSAPLILWLLAGLANPQWQVWPSPPMRNWTSLAVWSLFRALNVAVLAATIPDLARAITAGEIGVAQGVLVVVSVGLFAVYLYSLYNLGNTATYCQASGLVTKGLYRFSRNPQYATAMGAYATLGLATEAPPQLALAFSLVAVFALMAISEERWLEERYGAQYRHYRNGVPRFFNPAQAVKELTDSLFAERRRSEERP